MFAQKITRYCVTCLIVTLLLAQPFVLAEESKERIVYKPDFESLAQWESPQWFNDAVLGFYCHWGPYSVPGFMFTHPGERVDSGIWYGGAMYDPEDDLGVYDFHRKTYGEPCEFGYKDLVPLFKAEKWDPDRWARIYKDAGADFAGICAEHADGYAMWDSELDTYNSMDTGPRRDILNEMFESSRKLGMKTIATFHEPPGSIYGAGREHCPDGVDVNDPKHEDLYEVSSHEELYFKLIEVMHKYQPDQMWFEGAQFYGMENWKKFLAYYYNVAQYWGKDVVVTQKGTEEHLLASTALDIEGGEFPGGKWEWRGMEEPSKERWQKDVPLGSYWAYAEGVGCRPVNMLVDGIVDRISKNGVTLLSVAPKADGTLPKAQIDCLKELGEWMKINKEALYAARCAIFNEGGVDVWKAKKGMMRFTEKGSYLYAIELGNVWPTTKGFEDYEESVEPSAPYRIPGVTAVKGSKIFMLGADDELSWRQEGDDIIIETLPNPLPCGYAWSFKIEMENLK